MLELWMEKNGNDGSCNTILCHDLVTSLSNY